MINEVFEGKEYLMSEEDKAVIDGLRVVLSTTLKSWDAARLVMKEAESVWISTHKELASKLLLNEIPKDFAKGKS